MPADPIAAADDLRKRLADQTLPASFAQLYSQHVRIRSGQSVLRSFTEGDMRLRLADAVRLIEASTITDGRDERETTLRRAGELLEWLAHSALNKDGLPLTLLGAAAYQLAGYPARANSLASARPKNEIEAPLLQALLAADFNHLLRLSASVAAAAPRSVESRVEAGEAPPKAVTAYLTEVVVGEMASSLGVVAASLRWPDETRVNLALEKLDAVAPALLHLADPYSWLLVRLSASVATQARDRSLRTAIDALKRDVNPTAKSVLDRYARLGFQAKQALVWPSQQRGFERLARSDSFALCTPTGSGKTRVAEVALLDGLFRESAGDLDAPLCLYVVPSRALAAEVEGKLSRVLRDAGGPRAVTVTSLYGGADWGATDEWLTGTEPTVLICTQEKAEALIRFFGWLLLSRLSVVILDEAHAVQFEGDFEELRASESRPLRVEALVASIRARRPDVRFLAMSAVATQLERPLGQWISGEDTSAAVTVNHRSTRQVIGRLHFFDNGATRIEYDVLDGRPLRLAGGAAERPFVPDPFPRRPDPGRLVGTKQTPATFALWVAMQLASAPLEGDAPQTVLVSIAEGIGEYGLWWLELLEDIWADETRPAFFQPPKTRADKELWDRTLATSQDLFGERSREFRLLQHGIVVHHGRMPGRLPRLLTRLVERGIVRIVVATSVLSEGVNLPVQTVILPSMWRFSDRRSMSSQEFANLAGRAGRPGVATEGQTLVLIPGGTGAWTPQRADYDRAIRDIVAEAGANENAVSALGELVASLWEQWNGDEEGFLQWLEETAPRELEDVDESTQALDALDAVLIAALEDPLEADPEVALRAFWRQTFARRAAADETRLEEIFVRRGRAVATRIYADTAERSTLFRTSLPPREASTLLETTPVILEHLRTGSEYVDWDEHQRFLYVAEAMDLVSRVRKFAIQERIGASRTAARDVLAWWLGDPESTARPTVPQISTWHNFLQQQVRYRFTWGLGAVLAVAIQESPAQGLTAGDWRAAGIPWAAVWIKDLLQWGVLDPVTAYLLAARIADTRTEATELARNFYESPRADDRDPLDVNLIRDWASRKFGPRRRLRTRRDRRIPVTVSDRFDDDARHQSWHVIPVVSAGITRWLDPAGFELARSSPRNDWAARSRREDFWLQPAEEAVFSRVYV